MPSFAKASLEQLATIDARLQRILNEVIKKIDFKIIEGHRGKEAQNAAFAKGASKLSWPKGKHNAYPSRAVDIAPWFVNAPEGIDWRDVPAFGRLMGYIQRVAEEQGVRVRFGMDWDGDFRTAGTDPDEKFLDAPHVELVDP